LHGDTRNLNPTLRRTCFRKACYTMFGTATVRLFLECTKRIPVRLFVQMTMLY
jgi:hypothetical protein